MILRLPLPLKPARPYLSRMDDVDLALILAFDGSSSVTLDEFAMMASGCAAALRDPAIAAGLTLGPSGGSLLAVLLWSGVGAQEVMVEWTRVASEAEVQAVADLVENMPRVVPAGQTALGDALAVCVKLLATAPVGARRQVVDMVGDGRANQGLAPAPIRDLLVDDGDTINGLCVLHEEPDLVENYSREVIGGPGAFALWCQDFQGFAEAMRQKLAREIARAGPPVPAVT